MAEEENVRVAVRVRPFNSREKERKAKLIVDMSGKTTILKNPAGGDDRKFTFDFSYWSHDGFKEESNGYLSATGSKYADQQTVYNDLGVGIMNNCWEGFNSTLFAYGQTGSGKSYSIVGYSVNKGIVPMFCEQLFMQISDKKGTDESVLFEVTFSMLEIYNENVRDLLNTKSKHLKVRQHPKEGFYADGLCTVPVGSYKDIETRMEEGTKNRTVAATQMNATSSRAHTIVGVTIVQKSKNDAGEENAKSSVINLVDLAGNSKTIMIAAISPADINYDETLGTLRYADRAKQIKTKATVNENPTEKLIRELQAENARLMAMLSAGDSAEAAQLLKAGKDAEEEDDISGLNEEELRKKIEEEVRASMAINNQMLSDYTGGFQNRLDEAQQQVIADPIKEAKKTTPHLLNLNQDTQLSGMIVHLVKEGQTTVGNSKAKEENDLVLNGLNMMENHARLTNEGNKTVTLEKNDKDSRLLVNGESVVSPVVIHHNDRIMFGSNQLYMFENPEEYNADPSQFTEYFNYDMAQAEITKKSGFDMGASSLDQKILQDDLMDIMPAVIEANAISEELDKKVKFEVMVVTPKARGELTGRVEVCVKMRNLISSLEWVWSKPKFFNRKYVMQEMFQNFQEEEDWELPEDRDPFIESLDTEVHVGNVDVFLQGLAYMLPMKDQLDVTDFKGREVGLLNVELVPTHPNGSEIVDDDDIFIDSPQDLIGTNVNFSVKILGARGLPSNYTELYCKYKFFLDEEYTKTNAVKGTINPDFNHINRLNFNPCTSQFVGYLSNANILIQIWGKYKAPSSKLIKKNTREIMQQEKESRSSSAGSMFGASDGSGAIGAKLQMAALKKRQEKLEQKVHFMRKLLEAAEMQNMDFIPLESYKSMMHVTKPALAEKVLQSMSRAVRQPQKIKTRSAENRRKERSSRSSSSSSDDDKAPKRSRSSGHRRNQKESSTCQLM